MNRSFAQIPRSLLAPRPLFTSACALVLGACVSLPPPTAELAAAQQSVTRADGADADQYAAEAIVQARGELAQAQAAVTKGRDEEARALAAASTAEADLAYATAVAAKTRAEHAQHRDEVAELRQRLGVAGDPAAQVAADPSEPVTSTTAVDLAARLQVLESDPRLSGFAAYERLRAHQAVDTSTASYSRQGDTALRIADRRVAIAEIAARTEATRRDIDRLDHERSELLVEASRQEAEKARDEAERLRMQAQVQAEEAQRLRDQATAEAAARQQAEDVIVDVGAAESARLKAARDKDAALARQEAALLAAVPAAVTKPGPATKGVHAAKPAAHPDSASMKKKKK